MTSLRRAILLSFAVVCSLTLASVSLAQTPPQRDPQAIALLHQSLTAMNGNPGIGSVADLTIEADLIDIKGSQTTTRSMRVFTKGPRAIRWEIQGPEGQTVSIFAGDRALARSQNDEHFLKRRNLEAGIAKLPIFYLAEVLTAPGIELQLGEAIIVEGRTLDRIVVRRPGVDAAVENLNPKRSRTEFYIDRSTSLPARLTMFVDSQADIRVSFPLDIVFSDFRQVNGRVIPFMVATVAGTTTIQEFRVRSVAFNTGVADSLFQ